MIDRQTRQSPGCCQDEAIGKKFFHAQDNGSLSPDFRDKHWLEFDDASRKNFSRSTGY